MSSVSVTRERAAEAYFEIFDARTDVLNKISFIADLAVVTAVFMLDVPLARLAVAAYAVFYMWGVIRFAGPGTQAGRELTASIIKAKPEATPDEVKTMAAGVRIIFLAVILLLGSLLAALPIAATRIGISIIGLYMIRVYARGVIKRARAKKVLARAEKQDWYSDFLTEMEIKEVGLDAYSS